MNTNIVSDDGQVYYFNQTMTYENLPRAGDILFLTKNSKCIQLKVLFVRRFFDVSGFNLTSNGAEIVVDLIK